jgi:hypothetical protein
MRLIRRLHTQGVPLPERQVELFDHAGKFVARLDCGWRNERVGFEYFGGRHHGPRQDVHDRARLAHIHEIGWDVKVARKTDVGVGATGLYRWLAARLLIRSDEKGCRANRADRTVSATTSRCR